MRIGIIGGGISGLMAAYRLSSSKDNEIVIFEQGHSLQNRKCPILDGKTPRCLKCTNCSIMEGFGGAGAFSDGKYNITTEFGGWLQDIVGEEKTLQYIESADEILVKFGATIDRFMPNDELKRRCLEVDLHMLQSQCKHLGTDANYQTMSNFIYHLTMNISNLKLMRLCKVTNVLLNYYNNQHLIVYDNNGNNSESNSETFDVIIFATGRVGSGFFANWCEENNIKLKNNQVDIGVRVELPALVWEEFEKKIYEPKIFYRTKIYGDVCRMFCFNGRGEVVIENSNGVLSVNGHAYKAEEKKTKNTNFALLSTVNFTHPFNQPIEYAKHIASLANMISGGSVIVQRLGDLERGRRTDESRLAKSTVKPTLKSAVAGDLSLCIPKRQLDNIVETLHALDKIAHGTANEDTLLYGVECKYYSARPYTNDSFEMEDAPRCYAIGDGAGFTRSLAQAGAQGLMVADAILNKKFS